MTPLSQITARNWQLALDQPGDVVADLDDISQCIRVILTTPKGTDPLRPEFGSDLHLYLDYPIHRARPHVVRESVEAIRRWEPRVTVERVEFYLVEVSHAAIRVVWRLADGFQGSTEVKL